MTLTNLTEKVTQGTWIYFENLGRIKGKTNVYGVWSNDNYILGSIKWFGRWRKYCFFSKGDSIFEQVCLREIAEFCERETTNYKLKKKG